MGDLLQVFFYGIIVGALLQYHFNLFENIEKVTRKPKPHRK